MYLWVLLQQLQYQRNTVKKLRIAEKNVIFLARTRNKIILIVEQLVRILILDLELFQELVVLEINELLRANLLRDRVVTHREFKFIVVVLRAIIEIDQEELVVKIRIL